MNQRPLAYPIALVFLILGSGCNLFQSDQKPCTLEARINFCVTLNGAIDIPDSLQIIRTHSGGYKDTLSSNKPWFKNCFPEASGKMKVQVYRDTTLIKETREIRTRTVDNCHSADTTIDIKL